MGTTSVRGTVTDKTGAAVGGAQVTLVNAAQALQRETNTSPTGEYEFLALPPGTYAISISAAGFRKYESSNLQLLVNNPATLNVTLEIGTAVQTVEVSAQTETLNTTDASLGTAFNENQVKELPMEGRNVPDLLTLQAGVVYIGNNPGIDTNADTRSGAVNGARSDQSNVTLDGVPVNNRANNAFTSVLPVTLDSVQEFRVTTSNYNADQGGTGGAQVSLVTKSGTNQIHGSAYEYMRNTYTSANDYFNKQAELASGQANTPPKLIRNIFGASLGGPIKKDRLFLFMNFEGTRRAEAQVQTTTVPSDTLRDGIVEYPCQTAAQCPGGTVTGLSGKSYPVAAGNFALDPNTIKVMDPLHLGVNTAIQSWLNGGYWPHSNSNAVGDGLNTLGYVFSSPISLVQNWYIAKMDYNITRDGKHHVAVTGSLANVNNPGAQFLPGQPAESTEVNYNKGIIVSYSGVLSPALVNSVRYGFVRESDGQIGNSTQEWVLLRGLNDQGGAITRSTQYQRPAHNISDDLSWNHGKHTWQFGGVMTYIRDATARLGNSFSDGSVNSAWLDTGGISNSTKSPLNPAYQVGGVSQYNLPAVNSGFGLNYDFSIADMIGFVSEGDAFYNYTKTGSTLPVGAPVARHYGFDGYEMYAEDIWKVKPTFTLTLGLRYSLFSPPWETNGLQVAPSPNLGTWFNGRAAEMQNGIPSSADPSISFGLAGPVNNSQGYYNWDYKDFGPRVALAWAPKASSGLLGSVLGDGKSSIRAGFAIVYDRLGESFINTFDRDGAFGLSTELSNPAGSQSVSTAPRVTGINTLPTTDRNGNAILLPAPPGKFPQTFPDTLSTGGFAIAWGLDNTIKTPYAYTMDLSFARELSGGFSVETAYVGRLGHRLLGQEDVAQPLDIVDKKTGIDYYAAVDALATLYRKGVPTSQITPAMVGRTASYWADVVQPPQTGSVYSLFCSGGNTISSLQAAYDLFSCFSTNETSALSVLDGNTSPYGIPDGNNSNIVYNAATGPFTFFNPQYSSLYAWRSVGTTSYNALEVTLRHRMVHGIQFDANYTYSKSIDLSSDAQRIGAWGGLGDQITNAWSPYQLRGDSDYDLRHQFNTNFIVDLPFGRNRWLGHDVNKAVDTVIGGWQLTGLYRITSGFPVNVGNVFGFPTDWQLTGLAGQTGPVTTGLYPTNGNINLFANGINAINSFSPPLPGFSGARNQIRGEGFKGLDLGLSKRWLMPWSEKQSLQLRWEVFNVTNTPVFNIQTAALSLFNSSTFGNYTSLLNNPRVMQFALRFEF
ncbi:MAG TPA: TonB-dependent receptor [Candidatus Methylomirabilis sp.]|nr:TonB-dependent receptor [Candidatus Methylomirabilis sp.]